MPTSSSSLPVRINDSDYSRRWRLLGGDDGVRTYRMSADRSRIVFSPEFGGGNVEEVVVGRGLIKWYCATGSGGGGAKAKRTRKKRTPSLSPSREQKIFFLEVSPDCAFGPGAIEVVCLDDKVVGCVLHCSLLLQYTAL